MEIKIMSFNVLCYGPDGMFWTDRKGMVADILRENKPDSFGLQESHYDWMQAVSEALPEYACVGVGRDDGAQGGEFSPVFYLKDKYDVLDSGTFWLSETPDTPSYGWDAVCRRVCSWAKLRNKENGTEYVHINTHLDHIGPNARTNGLQMILDHAAKFDVPVVCTGDFNFREGCELYKQMTSGCLKDAKYAAEDTMSNVTFNAFYPVVNKPEAPGIIDFINFSKDVNVKKYKVITDRPDGKFPSDHNPVLATAEI